MMGLIFWLSSQPALGESDFFARRLAAWFGETAWLQRWLPLVAVADYLSSRVAHPGEYALLAMSYAWALQGPGRPARRTLAIAWECALVYGLLDEFHQGFVPNRQPSLADLLLDALGAAAGLWFYQARLWRRPTVARSVVTGPPAG
jgi:VanZ family protein